MRIDQPEELGAVVREYRTKRRMTQAHLARVLGVSRQWVISFESGTANASTGLTFAAIHAVGLRVDLREADTDDPFAAVFARLA